MALNNVRTLRSLTPTPPQYEPLRESTKCGYQAVALKSDHPSIVTIGSLN